MNKLLIIGAGGFGREVLQWALHIPESQRDWEIAGFLDPNPKILNGFSISFPILGTDVGWVIQPEHRFICAIGDPREKLRICRTLRDRGAQFISLVHPTALIGGNVKLGVGCIICPGVIITTNVEIGNFVTLNLCATIGHDATLGDGCTLSPHACVSGSCSLGEGVVMGSNAVLIPKIRVAEYTMVGAASVVIRRTRPNTTVLGVPAVQVYSGKEH